MKRIKEVSRETAGRRKRNPVVFIICEGTETEIHYFKRFRSRYCHIDILPIPSQYKAADKLVQKVKSTLGNNPYYPKDGDELFPNQSKAIERAEQRLKQLEDKHDRVICRESNPVSTVSELVKYLNDNR